jgi:SsrA-binding protein
MRAHLIAKNKKAYHDYQILRKLIVGIVLTGAEVKSVKNGQISLKEAYIKVINGEVFLWNCNISCYKYSDCTKYNPYRNRKLLAHRKEINKLIGESEQKGLTLIPLAVFDSNGIIKFEIGLARGLKQYDKRERERKRSITRRVQKARLM